MKDWRAVVAIILAVGVSGALIGLTVMEILRDGSVTEAEATVFSTALGAAVGAVATYLGGSGHPKRPAIEHVAGLDDGQLAALGLQRIPQASLTTSKGATT